MLSARDLSCRRGGRPLFAGIGFSVEPGQLLFVRGRNGCGKTTLLRAICGLTELESGHVYLNGEDIRKLDDSARADIVYVGHRDAVKDEFTPLENLAVHQGLRGERHDETRCLDTLEEVGLAGYEDVPVRFLSQGQRRRTALARLLLSSSPLWVLDEPLTALDTGAVDWLLDRLNKHLAQGGLAVTTSHQTFDGLHEANCLDLS
ncbi:heme ABC transporter ATP-binding protein CcmA [Thioalkalivibrio denitrificans]|uniref:Heme ABC transporter ATP-binding protein CcmA n=1 Tax=Thioalkalivibrio denitrificans TaxID=108003 RepID=A0A1V3NLD1_9GAMM|nr:cytochrome c biogenesis heme-transporting ATPase CcmA [Thioalkalivibrio denitrificans]OOG25688.1 heme ABC transporter ATP-binding protein CcmA [Thioalkalivibrio denitrificans]